MHYKVKSERSALSGTLQKSVHQFWACLIFCFDFDSAKGSDLSFTTKKFYLLFSKNRQSLTKIFPINREFWGALDFLIYLQSSLGTKNCQFHFQRFYFLCYFFCGASYLRNAKNGIGSLSCPSQLTNCSVLLQRAKMSR